MRKQPVCMKPMRIRERGAPCLLNEIDHKPSTMDQHRKDNFQVSDLHEIIQKISDAYGWDARLSEEQAKKVFMSLLDAEEAKHLASVFVCDGTLFARTDSPAARQELSYKKEMFRQAINENLHGEIIKEIVLQ